MPSYIVLHVVFERYTKRDLLWSKRELQRDLLLSLSGFSVPATSYKRVVETHFSIVLWKQLGMRTGPLDRWENAFPHVYICNIFLGLSRKMNSLAHSNVYPKP